MISAIVLAAGTSSRMGVPKQLIQLGNKTFVRITVESLLKTAIDEIIVVTGHHEDRVKEAINNLPIRIIHNPDYKKGQGTSLAAGVRALNEDSSAFLVFMCDQPLITSTMVDRVINEYEMRKCLALRPIYGEIPGHPVIFDYSLNEELRLLQGDQGARLIFKKLGDKAEYFEVEDASFIFDVDTPEDFKQLESLVEGRN